MRKSIEALFSSTRAELLSAVLLHPERWWFQSDLAKHLSVTPSTLQRELKRLTDAGIFTRRVDGKRVYYQADARCPFLPELQGLFLKTAGLIDVIAGALKPFKNRIANAAIFGSIAKGEELSRSDVDLLIVGDVQLADLSSALRKAEARIGREIQVMIYKPEEFRTKVKARDHFLVSVFAGPLLPIIGELGANVEATRS